MCKQATCSTCGKITWSGCGQHVDEVLSRVPKPQRCTCGGGSGRAATLEVEQGGGWLHRLFRR